MPTVKEERIEGDTSAMVALDQYVSQRLPGKDVVKEFVENMTHENFVKFVELPKSRRALLLRMYAEKHYDTNLGIVPYTS